MYLVKQKEIEMAKERGNIKECASRALHHADYTKFFPPLDRRGKIRILSIEDALRQILHRLFEIEDAADRGDLATVLTNLNQEFDFGKD